VARAARASRLNAPSTSPRNPFAGPPRRAGLARPSAHISRKRLVSRGIRDGISHALALVMSKAIPHIQKFMTTSPHSIGKDQTLARAHAVMREHSIRHLPVLDGGALVGLLSLRDAHLIETLKDVDAKTVTVEEAMSSVVYAVSPDAPLDEVASTMAEHKYGCAVIMQNHHVVGVFTTVDVCRALAELLHGRLRA
jgi:acetoin utilization protein AcuB